jgi:hypothetical protein
VVLSSNKTGRYLQICHPLTQFFELRRFLEGQGKRGPGLDPLCYSRAVLQYETQAGWHTIGIFGLRRVLLMVVLCIHFTIFFGFANFFDLTNIRKHGIFDFFDLEFTAS